MVRTGLWKGFGFCRTTNRCAPAKFIVYHSVLLPKIRQMSFGFVCKTSNLFVHGFCAWKVIRPDASKTVVCSLLIALSRYWPLGDVRYSLQNNARERFYRTNCAYNLRDNHPKLVTAIHPLALMATDDGRLAHKVKLNPHRGFLAERQGKSLDVEGWRQNNL